MQKTAAVEAYVRFQTKIAAPITPELIARGIAGRPGKITPEDVTSYIAAQRAAADEATRGATGRGALKGMGIGGGIGAGLGGLIGAGAARGNPLAGFGAGTLIGGAALGGIGAGIGALSGSGHRKGTMESAANKAKFLGNIAQSGELPESESKLRSLLSHATGTQKDLVGKRVPRVEKLQESIHDELKRQRMQAGFKTLGSLAYDDLGDDDDEIDDWDDEWTVRNKLEAQRARRDAHRQRLQELRDVGQRYFASQEDAAGHAKELHDLYSRGYGSLADRLRQHIS